MKSLQLHPIYTLWIVIAVFTSFQVGRLTGVRQVKEAVFGVMVEHGRGYWDSDGKFVLGDKEDK